MSEQNRHDDIQGEIIHVYDGIEEADNELPLWWLFTFYGALVFAIFYWFYFEGFGVGASPTQAYSAELQARAAQGGQVTGELLTSMALDSSAVATGASLFQQQCVTCHREDAGGNIGPNLTDNAWIHGGDPMDIHNTILNGAANGMPPWRAILGPTGVQQVTAYVLTLRNTNVDGKEAQGEPWVPGGSAGSDAPSEDTQDAQDAQDAPDATEEGAPTPTDAAPAAEGEDEEAAEAVEGESDDGAPTAATESE